jgi:hypothetical protein
LAVSHYSFLTAISCQFSPPPSFDSNQGSRFTYKPSHTGTFRFTPPTTETCFISLVPVVSPDSPTEFTAVFVKESLISVGTPPFLPRFHLFIVNAFGLTGFCIGSPC